MRKLAIAQLGSDSIDQIQFGKLVAFNSMTRILPLVLKHTLKVRAKRNINDKYGDEIAGLVKELENAKDLKVAEVITENARDLLKYANAYADEKFRLKLLNLSAEVALDALIELKSPGCRWLSLCETKV